jgi:hypothetical protein
VLITSAFSHADHSVTFDEYFDNVTLCGRARTSILPPNWNVFSRAVTGCELPDGTTIRATRHR